LATAIILGEEDVALAASIGAVGEEMRIEG
jgi:hypothetical protein